MVPYQPQYQYVLDSSALFDLKDHYPENVFPTIWTRFNQMCRKGYIVSPKEVRREIRNGNDELLSWAENYDNIFLEPTEPEVEIFQKVYQCYPESVIGKYATRPWADPLIVSCAKYYRLPIIQHESADPNQFKIPTIAAKFGIRCLRLIDFFKDQSWQF